MTPSLPPVEPLARGQLGAANGAELLHARIYDLLAHGWNLAEQALDFARTQLSTMPRTGRFGPAQTIADGAPAIDRLVAFLGRPVMVG